MLAQHRGRWLISGGTVVPARRLPEAPVTGDWVELDFAGAISAVRPRTGTLVRQDPGGGAQILAANVDLTLIVESLPDPNLGRAERLVALADAGGVQSALVLTKADLSEDGWETAARLGRQLGVVEAVAVSTRTGEGLERLRALLAPGRTAALLGPSGAGKSTLVNALLGEERQATQPVRSSDGRGRHTTVTRELIELPGGALIIDTPGLRSVALWEQGEAFADIDALAAGCRFADCGHDSEPGCAVRGAVPPERLEAWRELVGAEAWANDPTVTARERKRRARTLRSGS